MTEHCTAVHRQLIESMTTDTANDTPSLQNEALDADVDKKDHLETTDTEANTSSGLMLDAWNSSAGDASNEEAATGAAEEAEPEREDKEKEVDNLVEMDSDESDKEKSEMPDDGNDTTHSSSKPTARQFMNRFSSWREKANETLKGNILNTSIPQSLSQFASPTNNNTAKSSRTPQHARAVVGPKSDSSGPMLTSDDDDGVHSNSSDSISVLSDDLPEEAPQERVAASVVDTVASGFRGRYSTGSANNTTAASATTPKTKSTTVMTQSQTALIMQSRAAMHMQSILDSLQPHEYVMLLGTGMLGVNLKQAYLKNNGVYMDYLVPGGAAELSGVIGVGDTLIKVGDTNVFRKGLILNVPQTIAAAKRPVVLVLSTGQPIPLNRMNYIDVAVGMIHHLKEQKDARRDIASLPLQSHETETDESAKEDVDPGEDGVTSEECIDVTVLPLSLEGRDPMNVSTPPLALRELTEPHVAKRSNDKFSLSMLCQAATADAKFRSVLQNAFVTCVIDGRRLPFLSTHFSVQHDASYDGGGGEEDIQRMTANTELMLFLELTTFCELYFLTPETHRRDIAKRIAFKFFLPSKIGNSLESPMFDFHHIVPDSDLRELEKALNDTDHPIGPGVFVPFQKAIIESLSGPPFLAFLISDDCARMRGYLRNTAPFSTVSPGVIFEALGGETRRPGMENRLLYLLMHLVCQLENELGDEHVELSGIDHERVMGAAGGIACAVFIKKRLLKVMDAAKKASQSKSSNRAETKRALAEAMELVWETFIAPRGGMLDSISNSNETEASLLKIRGMLEAAAIISRTDSEAFIGLFASDALRDEFSSLFDHLLYDYAVNTYSKFKEHRFHEWMCSEVMVEESEVEPYDHIPDLRSGCIGRLLRKAKLPQGVSPHKPIRSNQDRPSEDMQVSRAAEPLSTANEEDISDADWNSRNAEYAIVFGSDDGSGDGFTVPNPAMDRTDIRRYVCQALVNENISSKASQFPVPPTLESYVTVPPLRRTPFSNLADGTRMSSDGWEISLVNFMVPNAISESDSHDEKALFGVSLVFQKPNESSNLGVSQTRNTVKVELVSHPAPSVDAVTPQKESSEAIADSEMPQFASPIRFGGPAHDEAAPHTGEPTRSVHVSVETPDFNRRLQQKAWSERMEDRKSVQAGPITVGIALVCRRNVILAMRDSLSRFFEDHSRSSEGLGQDKKVVCGPLIELLGNFSYPDVESIALKGLLEPYFRFGSSLWIDRPIQAQKHEFEVITGQHLVNCLPPIPLALLFVTLLLEQKVVFSSSRRSVLFSAVTSVTRLLEPLSWSHLLVPLVPSALARDLMSYPAPFVLGLSSEDPGNMQVLNSLPPDVTLVDLDVGRVILAPSFAHDDDLIRGSEDPHVTRAALRSQVLYLAQSLGILFGARLHSDTWNLDSPSISLTPSQQARSGQSDIDKLQTVCRSFLGELLTGTSSCCFWIEEQERPVEESDERSSTNAECTVLFDEDRFFHVKNLRARGRYKPLFEQERADNLDGPMPAETSLALSLDDFDLILESFLRCQSMSTFVSSRPKVGMAYY